MILTLPHSILRQLIVPMARRSDFPDVQGDQRGVTFHMTGAHKYIVQVLGRKEKIPQRFGVVSGTSEILMCLKVRYGEGFMDEFCSLLHWHFTVCKDDEDIWGEWRKEFAKRQVSFAFSLAFHYH